MYSCAICHQEDLMNRRVMVAREGQCITIHRECSQRHRWHTEHFFGLGAVLNGALNEPPKALECRCTKDK
jgi:hypothetical protein